MCAIVCIVSNLPGNVWFGAPLRRLNGSRIGERLNFVSRTSNSIGDGQSCLVTGYQNREKKETASQPAKSGRLERALRLDTNEQSRGAYTRRPLFNKQHIEPTFGF